MSLTTSEHHELAQHIETVVSSEGPPSAELLFAVSQAYSELAVDAIERVRDACQLLAQGLARDAVRKCEETPNLFSVCAALTIPAPERWRELHKQYQVALPPELPHGQLAQLAHAYTTQVQLQHLLFEHQELLASNAPSQQRLKILRALTQLEPANPTWQTALRQCEELRLSDLSATLCDAAVNNDLQLAREVAAEINAKSWVTSIPDKIKTEARDVVEQLESDEVDAVLQESLGELSPTVASADTQSKPTSVWQSTRVVLPGFFVAVGVVAGTLFARHLPPASESHTTDLAVPSRSGGTGYSPYVGLHVIDPDSIQHVSHAPRTSFKTDVVTGKRRETQGKNPSKRGFATDSRPNASAHSQGASAPQPRQTPQPPFKDKHSRIRIPITLATDAPNGETVAPKTLSEATTISKTSSPRTPQQPDRPAKPAAKVIPLNEALRPTAPEIAPTPTAPVTISRAPGLPLIETPPDHPRLPKTVRPVVPATPIATLTAEPLLTLKEPDPLEASTTSIAAKKRVGPRRHTGRR